MMLWLEGKAGHGIIRLACPGPRHSWNKELYHFSTINSHWRIMYSLTNLSDKTNNVCQIVMLINKTGWSKPRFMKIHVNMSYIYPYS